MFVLNSTIYSSAPGIEYAESKSGSGTQISFVRPYIMPKVKKEDNCSDLTNEKKELIRIWIESTSIFKMSN